ncbi:LysR family transcriptional regulator [Natronospirillum operosum]|uniref:LysR family transcriptional regulator n=1 Tax=Natronospirillum operosum TaxID=2759953 RepID=A0A4Z0WAS4_9GAMM|nr:LysR family transcriptional regulator [Natronospirillum operosum]TGG92831.1 LysR family transcriptional regulator [Natronospirillum operosum]
MIDKLEIHHLRTLSALYQFGNLSVAAEHLCVSQQATSLQLKRLREILGDPLFVRSGHGMVPTPYARSIQPHVHQVLEHLNAIPRPASLDLGQLDRTLVISATDYAQEVIVAPLLEVLKEAAPGVRIIITHIESAELLTRMSRGEIDLAFTSTGYVPEGLVSDPLFTERYSCVSADQTLARDEPLSTAQLAEQDFVITSPGTGSFQGSADAWFERQGLKRRVAVSAPSFFMTQVCLKHSRMVAFMPSRLLPCDGLHEIPLEKHPPGYEVVVAYHPSTASDSFMAWLLDQVKDRFIDQP